MRLTFYDNKLNRIAYLTSCISLRWETYYNKVGECVLEFNKTIKLRKLLKEALYVRFDEDDSDTIMIITGYQDVDNNIEVRGRSTLWILGKRAPVYSDETVIENDKPATVIWRMIYFAMDNSPWGVGNEGKFEVDFNSTEVGAKKNFVIDGDGLLEQVLNLAQENDLGFKVSIVGKNLSLLVIQPQEDEVYLCERFGNVYDSEYIYSEENFYNVAVIDCEKYDETKVRLLSGRTDLTGCARRELYLKGKKQKQDETDADFEARNKEYGLVELAKQKISEELSFETNRIVALGKPLKVELDSLGVVIRTRCVAKIYEFTGKKVKTNIEVGELIPIKK